VSGTEAALTVITAISVADSNKQGGGSGSFGDKRGGGGFDNSYKSETEVAAFLPRSTIH